MVMITEPFSQVCHIINSIMDSLFTWSPIRQSQPARAQQTSGLIDTMAHAGMHDLSAWLINANASSLS